MLRSNNYRILLSLTISLILIFQLVAIQVSNYGMANEDTQRDYELTSAQKSALANLRGGSDNLSLDLDWLSTGGGTGGTDFVNDIATDSNGNVIIVGTASYNVTLANLQISASEGQTAFVAKLNQFGYWTWAISIQGGSSSIVALDIDSNNMIYVLGVAYEQVTAGAYTIGTANSNDIFVAKINPQGGWVWAKSASTGYSADPAEIAVDGSGNVGIVGTFWNTITFGSTAFSSSGNSDIFVAKLNSGGNMWLWAESFGGENSDYGNAIDTWDIGSGYEGNCSSSQDNFVITGAFSSYIEFGGVNFTTNRYNSSAFVTWLCGSNGDVFSAIVEGESSGTNILRSWSTFSSWSLGTGWYSSSSTSNYDSCTGTANGYSYYYLYTYDCDYPNSLTYTSYATSPSVSGLGYSTSGTYTLEFDRLLGIEGNNYDHAYVQVYSNGGWYQIWANPSYTINESNLTGTTWNKVSYDISNYFPGNSYFQVRFGIGTTDTSVTETGWNIDNVRIIEGETSVPGRTTGWKIESYDSGETQESCVVLAGTGAGQVRFNYWIDINTGGYDNDIFAIPICAYYDDFNDSVFNYYSYSTFMHSEANSISDISIDGNNKLTISGSFHDQVTFGSTTLSSSGNSDVFVATVNQIGEGGESWTNAYSGGGDGGDYARAHAVTSTGSTIIGGYFDGESQFGTTQFSAYSEEDGLVAQLSSSGTWAWAKQIGGTGGIDAAYSSEILSDGTTAVVGLFQGTAEFGTTSISSNGKFDGYIAVYERDGTLKNIESFGSDENDYLVQIEQGDSGAIYVTGFMECISNNVYIFGEWVSCPNPNGTGNSIFVAKLDMDLNSQWVTGFGLEYGAGEIISLAEASDGSLFACGTHSEGTLHLGSRTNYISGSDVSELFCTRLAASNGQAQWLSTVEMSGKTDEMWSLDLIVDQDDDAVLTGNFRGTAAFGSVSTIASAGNEYSYDLFVASIHSNGAWDWAIAGGGQHDDTGRSIIQNSNGDYRLYGVMTGSAAIGNTMLTGSNSNLAYPLTAMITNSGDWSSASYFEADSNAHLYSTHSLTDDIHLVWFYYSSKVTLGDLELSKSDSSSSGGLGIGLFNSTLDEWVATDHVLDLHNGDSSHAEVNIFGVVGLDASRDGTVSVAGYYEGPFSPITGNSALTDGSINMFVGSWSFDADGDGIVNSLDDCPYGATGWTSDSTTDHDSDGCKDSDSEDNDDDNDGRLDPIDSNNPNWGEDLCSKGVLNWISDRTVNDHDSDGCLDESSEDQDDDNDGIQDPNNISNPMQGEDYCFRGNLNWSSASSTDHDSDGCQDDSEEDIDDDNDGVVDPADSQSPVVGEDFCPRGDLDWTSSPNTDHDGDGCYDDSEDLDDDNDGVLDVNDDCRLGIIEWTATEFTDYDSDGCDDSREDNDDDNDGILDSYDACLRGMLNWSSDQITDFDGDGCKDDVEDSDDDNDSIEDEYDLCPKGTMDWISVSSVNDHDSDGCLDDNSEDSDDDNDGVADPVSVDNPNLDEDNCYRGYLNWTSNATSDYDGDGCNDLTEDLDDDNDGLEDSQDGCPMGEINWDYSQSTLDYDSDGCSNNEDLDDDGDGLNDPQVANNPVIGEDFCPLGITGWISSPATDHDGDGCKDDVEDSDDDNDGILDSTDYCSKSIDDGNDWISDDASDYDADGCRDADEDSDDDNDGIVDRYDSCAIGDREWVSSSTTDLDGDGCNDATEDDDDDGDGTRDSQQFMLSGEGAGYTWMIIGSLIGAIVLVILLFTLTGRKTDDISEAKYREIENEVRQDLQFDEVASTAFSNPTELEKAIIEFPDWTPAEVKNYIDKGWTVESLKEWRESKD